MFSTERVDPSDAQLRNGLGRLAEYARSSRLSRPGLDNANTSTSICVSVGRRRNRTILLIPAAIFSLLVGELPAIVQANDGGRPRPMVARSTIRTAARLVQRLFTRESRATVASSTATATVSHVNDNTSAGAPSENTFKKAGPMKRHSIQVRRFSAMLTGIAVINAAVGSWCCQEPAEDRGCRTGIQRLPVD